MSIATFPSQIEAELQIAQFDVNTLKVIATFASQIEAELQTGIAGTNIRRGLRQGRPLGILSATCTVASS
jgi:hypothetical protein